VKRGSRIQRGSLVFNRRFGTWNFLWCENGHRRSKVVGALREFPTKASAWRAAELLRAKVEAQVSNHQAGSTAPFVKDVVERYKAERFPRRFSTARAYDAWLKNHILPEWGNKRITELQPRPVELWLRQLELSPKSKVHVKTVMRILVDFAMWCGFLEVRRNPMELVTVKGATKRTRQCRSLTVEEFHKLVKHLRGPFCKWPTLRSALVCASANC
jgi:integrase